MKKGSLINSFKYAIEGLLVNLKTERNLRIHFSVALLVIICGFIFSINLYEWLICLVLFGLIIALELMNTAFEKLADLCMPEIHPKVKFIKDTAASSVFVAAIIAVIVGIIIFLPKILNLFWKDRKNDKRWNI